MHLQQVQNVKPRWSHCTSTTVLIVCFCGLIYFIHFSFPSLLVCLAQSEGEWRGIGVQQSRGWMHYALHRPEPHILLFRRPLGTDPQTGRVDPELARLAREDEYKGQLGLPETARAM